MDSELAEMIRSDHIDILVDLSGHTGGNRLLVFARKPAPVQITAGGHYDTTGLDAINYLISDSFHRPPGSQQYFSEELMNLPNCYNCYAALSTPLRLANCQLLIMGTLLLDVSTTWQRLIGK